jgi:hypothetical protein
MTKRYLLLFCIVVTTVWGCKKGNSGDSGDTPGTTTDEAGINSS